MYVCMYVCMSAAICENVIICLCGTVYGSVLVCSCIYVYVCIYMHIFAHTHKLCLCACIRLAVYTCTYIPVHTCIYVDVNIYLRTWYVHTHTHVQTYVWYCDLQNEWNNVPTGFSRKLVPEAVENRWNVSIILQVAVWLCIIQECMCVCDDVCML